MLEAQQHDDMERQALAIEQATRRRLVDDIQDRISDYLTEASVSELHFLSEALTLVGGQFHTGETGRKSGNRLAAAVLDLVGTTPTVQ